MPRVVHFEIPAEETARAMGFYKEVFEWNFDKQEGMEYFLCRTGEDGPGIDGAITVKDEVTSGVVNTIGVASIDETIRKIRAAGGEQVTTKDVIPNVGDFCYCRDTEGNLFGILQPIM